MAIREDKKNSIRGAFKKLIEKASNDEEIKNIKKSHIYTEANVSPSLLEKFLSDVGKSFEEYKDLVKKELSNQNLSDKESEEAQENSAALPVAIGDGERTSPEELQTEETDEEDEFEIEDSDIDVVDLANILETQAKTKLFPDKAEREAAPKLLERLLTETMDATKEMRKDRENKPQNYDGLLAECRGALHVADELVKEKDSFPSDEDAGRFFGWIQEYSRVGEPQGAHYKGLSYIVFPMEKASASTKKQLYAVTLNVGLDDYGEDEALARKPGTRRSWNRLLATHANLCTSYGGIKFNIKMHLEDRTSKITEHQDIIPSEYQASTLAYAIVDAGTIKGRLMMLGMLAQYAKMRSWSNEGFRNYILNVMDEVSRKQGSHNETTDEEAVDALLMGRRFVVLQGAPGTGKTWLARRLAKKHGVEKPVFIQFHAETSYSDFVYGLQPNTANKDNLSFRACEGKLVEAIRAAQNAKQKPVFLIIDEINRANLASVLGPTFYLFEPDLNEENGVEVEIVPDPENASQTENASQPGTPLKLKALPPNLYVIATMNTADRSLAVVDFALRRRFAWYTLHPKEIKLHGEERENKFFAASQFSELSAIFDDYATEDELNLKPGPAYFIVNRKMVKAAWTEKDGANISRDRLDTISFAEADYQKLQKRERLERCLETLKYVVVSESEPQNLNKQLSSVKTYLKGVDGVDFAKVTPDGRDKLEQAARGALTRNVRESSALYELIQRAVNLRLQYEVMPLIKEYLAEGMLPEAKNEFLSYFWHEIGVTIIQ